jgi:hypothetical protein
MTNSERSNLAHELMQELGDAPLAPDATCRCEACVGKRREFNMKLLPLLISLMAEGGM